MRLIAGEVVRDQRLDWTRHQGAASRGKVVEPIDLRGTGSGGLWQGLPPLREVPCQDGPLPSASWFPLHFAADVNRK